VQKGKVIISMIGRMIIHSDDIIEPLDWNHSDFKSKLDDYLLKKKIEKQKASVYPYANGNRPNPFKNPLAAGSLAPITASTPKCI
jgi:hypothetical protein